MSPAKFSMSFRPWLVAVFALVAALGASGQSTNSSKKVLHADGTTTESVSDIEKGELRETTFDARGVLLSKRIVLLNDRGLPVQGMIYGGKDNLVGSVRFAYDDLGRVLEEISLNAQGQVFRRKIQSYDASGKPLPTKIVDYSQNAPKIASNTINFTDGKAPPSQGAPAASGAGEAPRQPGQAPQIQRVSPRGNSNAPEEKKKRGLFDFFKK